MISHKHRCIYIPIPKAGSTTLRIWLRERANGMNIDLKPSVPVWLDKSGVVSLISLYPDYLVFSFIRNPFDRFLSFFHHGSRRMTVMKEGRVFVNYDIVRSKQGNLIVQDGDYLPPCYSSLEECAEQKQQGLWDIKEDQYIGRHGYTYGQLNFERVHSQQQSHFLLDEGGGSCLEGSSCSFIGKVENFDQDFSSLSSILGLSCLPVKKLRVDPDRERHGRMHYSTYYTKRARRLVEEIYARDLELLGYEFEDETRTSVPVPLYDMDSLQEMRRDEFSSPQRLGIRIYRIWLYLLSISTLARMRWHRDFREKLLRDVVKKDPRLNYLYEKLYRPLKFRILGRG